MLTRISGYRNCLNVSHHSYLELRQLLRVQLTELVELVRLEVPVGWVHVERGQSCCIVDIVETSCSSSHPTMLRFTWRFLSPVASADSVARLNRFNAAFGWPVVLECCSLREVTLDLVQSYDFTHVIGEQLVPDSLNFAAELQIGQIPTINLLRLQLQIVSFTLKVEERNILETFLHCVGNNRLSVDAEEATSITCIRLFQNKFFMAQIQELVELFGVCQSHDQVLAGEGFFTISTVCVFQIYLVQEFGFTICDVVGPDAGAVVYLIRQHLEELHQQFPLHHPH